MPPVSVIIPVFNRKDLLARAVSSVMEQTFRDFELIIVDDGSRDGLEVCGLEISPQIRSIFLRNPVNRGVSHARNRGVSQAEGKYIAFLDSDDRWHPQKLARQIEWMRRNPDIRICQTREIWIRNGRRVNPPRTHIKTGGDLFMESLHRCMVTPSSVLMERNLFYECGEFNESLPAAEDYDLWLRITCRHPVGLVDDYLLTRFGGHADQLSNTTVAIDRYRIRALIDILTHTSLPPAKRKAAQAVLTKKARILAMGCNKRGNIEAYERFTKIAETYSAD